MTDRDLLRLNRRLGDCRGRNPHGDPVYRWIHSSSPLLTYPALDSETGTRYVDLRQLDADRWVVAMWYPPEPESEWRQKFPALGYPAQGQYYVTDMMLIEGQEPSDALTDSVIGLLKHHSVKRYKDYLDEIEASRARTDKRIAAVRSDAVDDACTAFNNLPGARGGHVSFGGFNVPLLGAPVKAAD